MNEFLLVIHRDMKSKDASPSPEQMQAAIKPFQDWIGDTRLTENYFIIVQFDPIFGFC
jgi:hypothetical protein